MGSQHGDYEAAERFARICLARAHEQTGCHPGAPWIGTRITDAASRATVPRPCQSHSLRRALQLGRPQSRPQSHKTGMVTSALPTIGHRRLRVVYRRPKKLLGMRHLPLSRAPLHLGILPA